MRPPTTVRQAGAIPYRVRAGDVEVALIMNRSGRRWIVPKGRIARGETPFQSALREAHEEAGVFGVLEPLPIGSLELEKRGRRHVVELFPMLVLRTLDDWPERSLRERRWLVARDAAALVLHPVLAQCIEQLAERVRLALVRDVGA